MNKCSRGFSVIESLIVFAILLMILGALAGFMQLTSRVSGFAAAHEHTLEGIQVGLDKISRELAGETAMITPPAGSAALSSTLSYTLVDPNASRLPPTFPVAPPATWDPLAPSYLINISWYVSNGWLVRKNVPYSGGTSYVLRVSEGVAGFSCQNLGNNSVALNFTFVDGNSVRAVSTQVCLP